MTETRHSHGTVRHDHEGGEVPHKHWPGDPRLTEQQEKTLRGSGGGASAAFGFGTGLLVIGALALLDAQGNHGACGSALVQMANPQACQQAGMIWTAGMLAVIVGITLIIAGAILRAKS